LAISEFLPKPPDYNLKWRRGEGRLMGLKRLKGLKRLMGLAALNSLRSVDGIEEIERIERIDGLFNFQNPKSEIRNGEGRLMRLKRLMDYPTFNIRHSTFAI